MGKAESLTNCRDDSVLGDGLFAAKISVRITAVLGPPETGHLQSLGESLPAGLTFPDDAGLGEAANLLADGLHTSILWVEGNTTDTRARSKSAVSSVSKLLAWSTVVCPLVSPEPGAFRPI